jgi:hypothetical protein
MLRGAIACETHSAKPRRSSQYDALSILGYEGKGTVDAEDAPDVTGEQLASSFARIDGPEPLGCL